MSAEPPGLAEFQQRRRRTFYPKTDLALTPPEVTELLERKRRLVAEFSPLVQERVALILGEPALLFQPRPDLGTFHSIYFIRTGTGDWVLRADMLGVGGRGCDLLVDQQISRLLLSRDFPATRVLGTDQDRTILPFDFQVSAKVPGHRVKELEDPGTQVLPLGWLGKLGACLRRIHEWNVSGTGLLDPYYPLTGLHKRWDEYLLLNLQEHMRKCLEIEAISPVEAEKIENHFASAAPKLSSIPGRLLHGDFGHHNIFISNGEVSGVIDWEDALGGDPIFDIAYWGTFVREEMRAEFLSGYHGRDLELSEEFEFRYWLYYLRIALSKTVHRWLFSAVDRLGRPPASRRIQLALAKLEGGLR